MQGIVCISGTNRPDNYTSRALQIVIDELRNSGVDPIVFDARALSLAFPGHPDTGDGQQLRTAVAGAPGVISLPRIPWQLLCNDQTHYRETSGFPSVLAGKPVALLGVAAGRIGAIKSLEQLKSVCSHIGAIVVPGSVSVAACKKFLTTMAGAPTQIQKLYQRPRTCLAQFPQGIYLSEACA